MPISALIVQTSEGTFGITPSQITRYYVLRGEGASSNLVIETVNHQTVIKCPSSAAATAKHQALLAGLTTGTGILTLDDLLPPTTTITTTAPPTNQDGGGGGGGGDQP